jgi:hypothetical protein
MLNLSYSGFNELIDKCPYVKECQCNVSGQGLYNTYDIICLGTGKNKYQIILEKDGIEYRYFCRDDFIIVWRTKSSYEGDNEIQGYEFKSYGNFNYQFNCWIYSASCDDLLVLDIHDTHFNVKGILVIIENISSKPIKGIGCDYIYVDKIMNRRYKAIEKYTERQKYQTHKKYNGKDYDIITLCDFMGSELQKAIFFTDDKEIYEITKMKTEPLLVSDFAIGDTIKGNFVVSYYNEYNTIMEVGFIQLEMGEDDPFNVEMCVNMKDPLFETQINILEFGYFCVNKSLCHIGID